MKTILKANEVGILDRMLDPLSESLTPPMAQRIVDLRADATTQERVEELASKCKEGELTAEERDEYEAYVRAIHVMSILQSKARMVLAKKRKPR